MNILDFFYYLTSLPVTLNSKDLDELEEWICNLIDWNHQTLKGALRAL